MIRRTGGLLALAASLALPASVAGQAEEAETALRAGRYDEAVRAFRALLGRPEAYPAAARGLVRTLAEVGRYGEAEEAAREAVAAHPDSPEMLRTLGEILVARGRLEEAERIFEAAVAGGASDAPTAELRLAILRHDRGEREEAIRAFDRFFDLYNESTTLDAEALTAVGTALTYLGAQNPDLYRGALRVFDEAIAADPGDPEPRLRLGDLFLDKYNSLDAGPAFQGVLEANPDDPRALLGMARRAQFDGSAEALQLVLRSLSVNENLVPARVFLARLYLDLNDTERAKIQARRALEVNPASLEALSVLAAAQHVAGELQGFRETEARVLALNPRYADLYGTVAEVAVRNHLYADAVEFARQATELDPISWRARSLLGLNLLRLGEIGAGRRALEIAFEGDPYNPWVKNTLDLLDRLSEYVEVRSPRFRFVMDPREAELLEVYLPDLAEEAFDRLAERYGYRPETPIRLELFSRHADFSVRTVGLAGFGALGVSFGNVLAMNSPSARERGSFNWGSTLWHEISHAFTLGRTRHRVPRWLTEGLAVHDERQAREGWGSDVTPSFLLAYKEGKLRSVAELNYGFVRPTYPQQVVHSYFQASLVCQMIEEEEGLTVLLAMLDGYRDGLETEEVFARVLHTDLAGFDMRFRGWLETRFGGPLAALKSGEDVAAGSAGAPPADDFTAQLGYGLSLYRSGRLEEAHQYLERARTLFPEYAGPDSPYLFLARIHAVRGEPEEAAGELERLTRINEDHYEANLELADLLEEVDDPRGAAAALVRAIYIWPFEAELHDRLAELHERSGSYEDAVRERRGLVALDPVDRPGALYRLALANYRAGDRAAARRDVLRALEAAPNYEEAQDLLLRLREEDPDRMRE